jgi:DNA-binding response OmpR family regulator
VHGPALARRQSRPLAKDVRRRRRHARAGRGGRLLTYAQVAQQLRTRNREVDQGTLRVFVAQLRKKLGDDAADPELIVTHFGLGYRWIAGEDDAGADQSGTSTW